MAGNGILCWRASVEPIDRRKRLILTLHLELSSMKIRQDRFKTNAVHSYAV